MIVDRIERLETYFRRHAAVEQIVRFLKTLSPQTAEKEYEISGKEVFARVMSYDTVPRTEGKVEAHEAYADIQATITGSEVIEWCPRQGLVSKTPYDPENDVEFFQIPARMSCSIRNVPGMFSLFFPEDAHMPKIADGDSPGHVKKAVVKVRAAILEALLK